MNTMVARRDALAGRLPITLITGFLGSGKTTLISKLVRHPEMNRCAVVINEVGEIGIDHDLVSMSSEQVTLLANGCLCCTVRTDLQETLRMLFGQRRAGQIADFDRVVVETTGLADPAPVIQTLVSDSMLAAQYRLDGVVTLVDAVNGAALLDRQTEAQKQVILADRILMTKGDLARPEQVHTLRQAIATLNRQVEIEPVLQGQIDPARLCGLTLASSKAGPQTLRFLGEAEVEIAPGAAAGGGDPAGHYLGERLAVRHDAAIKTLSLRFDTPFTWSAFSAAMELLTSMRGADLLRVKGIVNVAGAPVVVQCVQHIFHEPVHLDGWPSADLSTRLVFITRNIDEAALRGVFTSIASLTGGVANGSETRG